MPRSTRPPKLPAVPSIPSLEKISPTGYFHEKALYEANNPHTIAEGIQKTQREVLASLRRLRRSLNSARHPQCQPIDLSHLRHNDAAFWALITAERSSSANKHDRYGYHSHGQDKASPIFNRRSSPLQHALVETRDILDITQEQWAAYLGVHWTTLYRAEAWNTAWSGSPHVDKLVNLDYVRSALYWLNVVIPEPTPASPTHSHAPRIKHHLSFYLWCRENGVPYRIGLQSESIQDQAKASYRRNCIRLARLEGNSKKLNQMGKRKTPWRRGQGSN